MLRYTIPVVFCFYALLAIGQLDDTAKQNVELILHKQEIKLGNHELERFQFDFEGNKLLLYDFRKYNLYEILDNGELKFLNHKAPEDSLRLYGGAQAGNKPMLFDSGNSKVSREGSKISLKTKSKFKQHPCGVDYHAVRWRYIEEDKLFVTPLCLDWPGWDKTLKLDKFYDKAFSLGLYDSNGKNVALLAPYPRLFKEKKYLTYMHETWFFVNSEKKIIYVGHESESTISTYDYSGKLLSSTELVVSEFAASTFGEIKSEFDSRLYKVPYRIEAPNFGRIIYDKENDLLLRFYSPAEKDTTTISETYKEVLDEWIKDKSETCVGPHRAESFQLKQLFQKAVFLMVFKQGKYIDMIPVPFNYFSHYAGISPDGYHTIQTIESSGIVIYKFKIRLGND